MKVLLIGGSGFIGTRLRKALAEAGHQLVCTSSTDEGAARLAADGITATPADICDPQSVVNLAGDADAVINLAFAATDPAGAERGLAEALLAALRGTGKTLLWTSGVGVTGASTDRSTDETAALAPTGPVAWRGEVETMVVAAGDDQLRTIVIRPSIVYDGAQAQVYGLLAFAAQGADAVPYPDDGDAEWSTVHAEDLADLYVRALHAAPTGSVYIASSDHYVRVKDLAAAASTGLGLSGRTVSMPLEQLRGRIGPVADLLATPAAFSSARARRDLGWTPTAPVLLGEPAGA